MATNETTADSKPTFTRVPTDDVDLDPNNPRLGDIGGATQDELKEILLAEPHFAIDLVESFVENGFIEYEPLIVRKERTRYVVIEGNRRLAAVKHIISNPEKYPSDLVAELKEVPVLIFHYSSDASHLEDMRVYLGVRHLQGYREWPAESKAIFLDKSIKPGTDIKKLKSEFGIERNDISRFLIPYRVRKKSKKIVEDFKLSGNSSFWILGEALSRSGIKEYIGLKVQAKTFNILSFDAERFRKLMQFLYGLPTDDPDIRTGRRITDTRELSRLAKVLTNERARKKLEGGSSLEESEFYIETPEETISLQITVVKLALKRIKSLKPKPDQLLEIQRVLEDFLATIRK